MKSPDDAFIRTNPHH